MPAPIEPRSGEATRRRLVPQWVGLCLYAGCTVARGIAGLGGGGTLAGIASLPDAPNAPGLGPGIAGSAGSIASTASSGPGGAVLCPPGERAARPGEYEPDLEDEIMWRSLRKAVPDLDEWDDYPGEPGEPPAGDPGDGGSGASTHGFGDQPGSPGAGDPDRPLPEGKGDSGHDPPPEPDRTVDEGNPGSVPGDGDAQGPASTHGFGTGAEPPGGDDQPAGSGGSIHGFGDEPPGGGEVSEPEEARHGPPSLMRLIRSRPCAFMAIVGLVVSLVALGFEFAYLRRLANPTGADILRNLGYGAWTLGLMMVATLAIRTVRLRDVVRFWLVGFFAATGIVAIIGMGVTAALEPGLLRTAIVIPIVEELVKAMLLAAFLVFAVRGRGREPSVTDMAIIGFALGAAFGVHEDALWARVGADGFGSGIWGTMFPGFVWENFVVVGHAGWAGLSGLGLGLAWHFRRFRPAWALALVPLAIAIFDHVSINYVFIEARGREGVGWTMREMTNHGSLVAQALVAGFVLAVVVDWLALRRQLGLSPLPAWSTLPGIRSRLRTLPAGRAKVLGTLLLLGERRAHLGARFAQDRGPRLPAP